MCEVEIPWIIYGNTVRKGFNIPFPIYVFDTAATIAYTLKSQRPYEWIGRPAVGVFEGESVDYYTNGLAIDSTNISPKPGIYLK